MSDYYDSEESNGKPCLTLLEEIWRGDYVSALTALDSGSDPNDTDFSHGGYTLHHWAAEMTDRENLI